MHTDVFRGEGTWCLQLILKWLSCVRWHRLRIGVSVKCTFPSGSGGTESACNVGDLGSIAGLGRSPGEGNGNPLQYSFLENSMDGGAWWATVHGVTKSQTRLSDFTSLHFTSVCSGSSVVGLMATSSKRVYAIPKSAAPRAPVPAAVHCWPVPPQEMLKHSSVSVSVGSLDLVKNNKYICPLKNLYLNDFTCSCWKLKTTHRFFN